MAKTMTIAAAIVAAATVLAFSGGAPAQTGSAKTPTQADFDLCNQEAKANSGASTSGGSALPGTSPSVGSPSTATPGSVGAGSSASDSVGAGAAAGGSTTGGSTLGSGSVNGGSSLSGDTQLRGLAAAGSSNSAYQSSYRDCMKRRGF